ncbi:MAG: cysteine hydrolase [Treponemataceae bacterium]|nr:cysteine hydrolase [Treponemataceae bacterium]
MEKLQMWSMLAAFCALAVCGCSKKASAQVAVSTESETIGMSGRMMVSADGGNAHSDIAILVIDMQNDFVLPGAVLCVAGAQATIPTIQDLLSHGRAKGWHVIHVIREHRSSGCDVDMPRVPLFTDGKQGYCVPGTKGWEIVEGLEPQRGDIIVSKRRNSGFFQTELDMVLRRLGVKTVVLAGTQYPNCVRGTAVDAMSYDYNTVVCTDACSAKTPEVAEANIFDMKNMGITCIPLAEVKKRL